MADIRERERMVNDLQQRLMRQRESLESRESTLLDDEERIRSELVELVSKRNSLNALEAQLLKKENQLKERELDADNLLIEASREKQLFYEMEREIDEKFRRVSELALELESRDKTPVGN